MKTEQKGHFFFFFPHLNFKLQPCRLKHESGLLSMVCQADAHLSSQVSILSIATLRERRFELNVSVGRRILMRRTAGPWALTSLPSFALTHHLLSTFLRKQTQRVWRGGEGGV